MAADFIRPADHGLPLRPVLVCLPRVRSAIAACLLFLVTGSASAQIYADFTVSSGGSSLGTFRARLDFDKAPRTCANFVGLATGERPWIDVTTNGVMENTPYYDGRIFHRLIHNFMIQGGSSDGIGSAGSGLNIQDEFHADLRHSGRYMLSMAKASSPGTGNAQFFITLVATPHLDDKHSVFGEVIDGLGIIDGFTSKANFPTDRSVAGAPPSDSSYADKPITDIVLDSVTISGPSLAGFDIHDPALELPTVSGIRPAASRDSQASSFTTTFERKAGHDYLFSHSLDLGSWSILSGARNILSLDHEPDHAFTVTGVTFDRFFARMAAVDFSFLQNPAPSILGTGSTLTFTARSGKTLTLQPNESGGGTWADSDGHSGVLAAFSATDAAPATGDFTSGASQAFYMPLLNLTFELDSAGGPAGRTKHSLTLDFRENASGWSDGSAWTVAPNLDVVSFLHAFQIEAP